VYQKIFNQTEHLLKLKQNGGQSCIELLYCSHLSTLATCKVIYFLKSQKPYQGVKLQNFNLVKRHWRKSNK